jgi:hypothetical protein
VKKLLASLLVVAALVVPAIAEDGGAYFKWGEFELTYPLSNASATALYDFWKGEGLMGVETSIADWKMLSLDFGAVTSFKANGMPFASVNCNFGDLIPNIPVGMAKMGLWYGHDFKLNENRAGIKAIVPLWPPQE